MNLHDTRNSASAPPGESDVQLILCKLFKDTVTVHLCLLRKQELGSKNDFSCEGCPWSSLSVDSPGDESS